MKKVEKLKVNHEKMLATNKILRKKPVDRQALLDLYGDESNEILANAALISAAPDMLEVLEELLNAPVSKVENKALWRKASLAIKKARGE